MTVGHQECLGANTCQALSWLLSQSPESADNQLEDLDVQAELVLELHHDGLRSSSEGYDSLQACIDADTVQSIESGWERMITNRYGRPSSAAHLYLCSNTADSFVSSLMICCTFICAFTNNLK